MTHSLGLLSPSCFLDWTGEVTGVELPALGDLLLPGLLHPLLCEDAIQGSLFPLLLGLPRDLLLAAFGKMCAPPRPELLQQIRS